MASPHPQGSARRGTVGGGVSDINLHSSCNYYTGIILFISFDGSMLSAFLTTRRHGIILCRACFFFVVFADVGSGV